MQQYGPPWGAGLMGARGSERGGRVGRRLGSELGLVEEGGRGGG